MELIASGVDQDNGRAFVMFRDQGFEFRINYLLYEGAKIPMHSHSYDHDYRLGRGVYGLVIESPEGVKEQEVLLPPESRGHVPKLWKHHFRLVKMDEEPGRIDCYWPVGA